MTVINLTGTVYYMSGTGKSPVLQIRMPEAEFALLRDEAAKRGKPASALARDILSEVLTGPGVATAGRLAAKKAVIQGPDRAADVLHGKQKRTPKGNLSDRVRQMRENG